MVGQTLGRYRLLERLGAGGMGVVYRARDERLDREVAVKILPEATKADARARRRFRQEAEAISRLNHPNVATIHDFDEVGGTDLLVMELIAGETLRDRLDRGRLTAAEFRSLAPQLVEGLAAAHAAGVLHRDLKPANVRVTPDGRLKILDFGLARLLAPGDETRTDAGGDLRGAGTPPYLAPEQLAGADVDERADTYAAGATLYEMALGRRLFPDARGPSLLHAVLNREPEPPRQVDPGLDPALETLLVKAIDKDRDRRYQSARDLLVDLRRLGGAPATPARTTARGFLGWVGPIAVVGCLFWIASQFQPSVAAFPERGWVLIANLENQTDDPKLESTVRNALTIALQQSQYVNVLTRERVVDALERMELPPDTVVDEAIGREICRREGVQVLIGGSILQSGRTTRIAITAIDATSDHWLFVKPVQYDRPEDLFGRADALAAYVRGRLGESVGTIRQSKPLAAVTTGSNEALTQYSNAIDAWVQGDLDRVAPGLQAALALDPDFVMAHAKLGDFYAGLGGNRARALEEYDRAYALRGSLPERERLLVEALYFSAHEQWVRTRDSLAALVHLYPDDPAYRYELGMAHANLGNYARAVAEVQESLAHRPNSAQAYGSLVLLLALDNRPEEAVAAYRTADVEHITSPVLQWGLGLAEWGRADLEAARDAFTSLAAGEGFYEALGQLHLARLSLYQGRTSDAIRELDGWVRRQEAAGNTGLENLGRSLIAHVELLSGRPARARRHIDAVLAADPGNLRAEDLRWTGAALARLPDLAAVRKVLAQLDARRGADAAAYNDFAYFEVAGWVALAEGQPRRAEEAFRRAAAAMPSYYAWVGLAISLERLADTGGAVDAWTRVISARGEILRHGLPLDWGLSHLSLARLLDGAGRPSDACAHYGAVIDLWRNATVPAWLDEARGRFAALGCAPDANRGDR